MSQVSQNAQKGAPQIDDHEIRTRRALLEIDENDEAALRGLDKASRERLAETVERIVQHLGSFGEGATLAEPDRAEALKQAQLAYFSELTSGSYDREFARSRLTADRAGTVSANLGPQFYLAQGVADVIVLDPRSLQVTHYRTSGVQRGVSPLPIVTVTGCMLTV